MAVSLAAMRTNGTEASFNLSSDEEWDDTGNQDTALWGTVTVVVLLSITVAITVVGNILVLLAVATHRSLQTLSNAFLVSLCVSDLLVGALVMPPAVANTLHGEWIFSSAFCPVWVSFDVMLCSASILNLCVISLDRYIQITRPLQHDIYITPLRGGLLIALAWLLAILASFPPINLGWHEHSGHPSLHDLTAFTTEPQCIFDPSKTYALTASIVTYYIPLAAIFFTYSRIFKEAKSQATRVASLNKQFRTNESTRKKKRGSQQNGSSSFKAIRTLGIILGAFMITWLPFFISNIVRPFCDCVPGEVFEGLTWLGWCNSAMNPIIYPLFIKDFKQVFRKYMPCCRRTRVGNAMNSIGMPASIQLNAPSTSKQNGTWEISTVDSTIPVSNHGDNSETRATIQSNGPSTSKQNVTCEIRTVDSSNAVNAHCDNSETPAPTQPDAPSTSKQSGTFELSTVESTIPVSNHCTNSEWPEPTQLNAPSTYKQNGTCDISTVPVSNHCDPAEVNH